MRDQVSAGLSAADPEAGNEKRPSVSELAEQINALKGANTIEATPARLGKRRSSAEKPVAARIRCRTEALSASEPAIEPDFAAKAAATSMPPEYGLKRLPRTAVVLELHLFRNPANPAQVVT